MSNSTASSEKNLETVESIRDSSSIEGTLADHPNPFLSEKVADHYRELWEQTKYECRGRFDPDFVWTEEEERKLTQKLDWKVTTFACVMFVALQVDRGNLAQAVADNMLDDLGMSTNEYNLGNTIFYLTFLCAELPSQLISKRIGCDIWIPTEMCLWSLVSISQCRLKSKAGFYVTRALLGIFEGGFIPDLILWMSYFYTSAQLTIRLSFFWTSLDITRIITSLLAFAIFHISGKGGLEGWSWLFLIEGLFTLLIGILAFFIMVPSSVQTKKPWNKKGWFTERQEKIVVNRVLRDDPTKGDMHNRQGLTPKMLFQAVSDWHLWPIYIVGIVAYIPTGTVSTYLTLLLRQMGYSTLIVNVLAIPHDAIHIIMLLFVTWLSERTHSIFNVSLIMCFWEVPLIGVLRYWKGSLVDRWPTYIALTLLLGAPYIHAIMVSACSRNSQSIKNRTVSASVYNMFVQAGSIISSNIYRTEDRPFYHKGNTALFGIAFSMFGILILSKLFYVLINRHREKKWNALTPEEQEEYILTTKDKGSSRLNFRFAH